jgi:hypothetical protein
MGHLSSEPATPPDLTERPPFPPAPRLKLSLAAQLARTQSTARLKKTDDRSGRGAAETEGHSGIFADPPSQYDDRAPDVANAVT